MIESTIMQVRELASLIKDLSDEAIRTKKDLSDTKERAYTLRKENIISSESYDAIAYSTDSYMEKALKTNKKGKENE